MVIMMELRIREILCYMLCCFCVNMVSGVVNLTASGYFTDSTYVVQKGSSLTLTCSNDNKATSVTISDKDGAALGTCTVFLGAFTCSPSSSYTVDATDASVNYFNFVLSNFQTSNCGTYKCEMATDPTVFSSINVEQEVYYDDPCGTTCGTCEVNTFDCQATTNKCVCKGNTNPDPDDKTKCLTTTTTPHPVCHCKVLKIVWSVLFIVFSTGSGAWILYVLFAVPKARKWLTEKLCAPTHLCMIGWVVVSFVYSIIAVILYNILVCKDESSEADCWPVYLIIGIVVKGGDVAVSLLALLAFLNGVDKGDAGRNPPERRNNKSKVRNDPASHVTRRSEPPVSTQHKDAKAKEAMDSQSTGSAVSKSAINPTVDKDATAEVTLRPQPLPPVGQQGHGRGLSANLGDQYDDMPLVSQKNVLPPLGAVGEDEEVKKSKKKKSKKKREEDDIV
ncbi:uncharacterized protein LOC128234064 isoform X3 [Mya arenaria]|uniref:uncharacterized protein LOC128234064 isoform X3 n=1 Tax=Mya arenaria TaxID=6604 RepID=UPI0022DFD770|nr:uncharacterized protein LOC128234064 isoform X3 [Mya arenaria]